MAAAAQPPRQRQMRVVAAIVHHSGRVLLVQRRGDPGLRPPSGHVARGETPTDAIQRIVRGMTGFAVAVRGVIAVQEDDDSAVTTVRCEIRGIGSDFTGTTTGLRWCDAAEVGAFVDDSLACALRAAIGRDGRSIARATPLAS